jgi:hypothetical protein
MDGPLFSFQFQTPTKWHYDTAMVGFDNGPLGDGGDNTIYFYD